MSVLSSLVQVFAEDRRSPRLVRAGFLEIAAVMAVFLSGLLPGPVRLDGSRLRALRF